MSQDLHDDLSGPAFQADPHSAYARLRRSSPVRRVQLPSGITVWLVTGNEDARRALTDPRLLNAVLTVRTGAAAAWSQHMLAADPPDHTRLRRLVSGTFTARRIEALRPRIEQITDDLLAAMAGRERFDLLDAFAFPLPIQVICELLGIPDADRDSFRGWSDTIMAGSHSGDRLPAVMQAMTGYIRELIAERRAHPGDDLLSGLAGVRDADDRLSENELSSMVFLLLIAGHETTANLIGNGVYLLLERRERWERLRSEPALLPTAIEEFLRFEGPVGTSTFRIAAEDFVLGGAEIKAGEAVMVVLLSADRDERRFPGADELRLDRTQNPHLAFGHGIHYCLGAPLARLEAKIAFGRLLERFPRLRLAVPSHELIWHPGVMMRGLQHLPVVTA